MVYDRSSYRFENFDDQFFGEPAVVIELFRGQTTVLLLTAATVSLLMKGLSSEYASRAEMGNMYESMELERTEIRKSDSWRNKLLMYPVVAIVVLVVFVAFRSYKKFGSDLKCKYFSLYVMNLHHFCDFS